MKSIRENYNYGIRKDKMGKMQENLSEDQMKILKVLDGSGFFEEIIEMTGFSEDRAGKVLDEMIELGLIVEKVI